MVSFTRLNITGYRDEPLANSFIRQERPSERLAITLPGYAYTADMPVLYYTRQRPVGPGRRRAQPGNQLSPQGGVRRAGARSPARMAGRRRRRRQPGRAGRGSYRDITLIGKSIGTLAAAHLAATSPRLSGANCIWLTPIFHDEHLCSQIKLGRQRGLFVAGSADPLYDAAALADLAAAVPAQSLVIDGADHSLEIPGDPLASLHALTRVVQAVQDFLVPAT